MARKKNVDVSKTTNADKLKQENALLKKKVEELTETLNNKLGQLIEENKELRKRLEDKKTEKFVGIRSVTGANVWLPAPESKTGDPATRNMGRMLKAGKTTIVPSYWVVDWIASNYLGLKLGDVVIDNEQAKKISPNVEFDDIDIPEDFYLFEYTAEQIREMAKNNVKALVSYVNKNKKNVPLLNQVRGILADEQTKYKEDSPVYIDIDNLLTRIVSYISKE